MPILITMYRFIPSNIDLRQQPFCGQKIYPVLILLSVGVHNIPVVSSLFGNHISLFTILMAISSIAVTKLTSQTQPTTGGDNDFMAQNENHAIFYAGNVDVYV